MRVMERLQHGLAAAGIIAATFAFATVPKTALGQIVTPTAPYGQSEQGSGTLSPEAQQSAEPATSQLSAIDDEFCRARHAVALGDLASATSILQRIEGAAQQPNFGASQTGDSIQNIRTLIQQQTNLAQMAVDKTPGYNEQAANFLLQQATAILKYNDVNTAEMLASQAQRFPVDFATQPIAPSTICLLYTSPSPRDKRQSRMPSSA